MRRVSSHNTLGEVLAWHWCSCYYSLYLWPKFLFRFNFRPKFWFPIQLDCCCALISACSFQVTFLADLVNCSVVSSGSLIEFLESFLEAAYEENIPQVSFFLKSQLWGNWIFSCEFHNKPPYTQCSVVVLFFHRGLNFELNFEVCTKLTIIFVQARQMWLLE